MRWEDTFYIKLYRPPQWSQWRELPLEVRGFFDELMLVVDSAGLLECGPDVIRTVSKAVNGEPDKVSSYIDALIDDGAVVLTRGDDGGNVLVIRNFVDAQSARATDRMRREQSRQRARDKVLRKALDVNGRQQSLPLLVSQQPHQSHGDTRGDTLRLQERQERRERKDQLSTTDYDTQYASRSQEDQDRIDALYAAARGEAKKP